MKFTCRLPFHPCRCTRRRSSSSTLLRRGRSVGTCRRRRATMRTGTNCIKIGLPGKSIHRDYFQESMTSQRPFLLLKISFPGRPIFIQLPPGATASSSRIPTWSSSRRRGTLSRSCRTNWETTWRGSFGPRLHRPTRHRLLRLRRVSHLQRILDIQWKAVTVTPSEIWISGITKWFWVTIEGYLSYLLQKDLVPTRLGCGAI